MVGGEGLVRKSGGWHGFRAGVLVVGVASGSVGHWGFDFQFFYEFNFLFGGDESTHVFGQWRGGAGERS